MALTHIDCFSGPGGICTGLHAAGFETLIAIEFIKSCVDTYAANHPDVHVMLSILDRLLGDKDFYIALEKATTYYGMARQHNDSGEQNEQAQFYEWKAEQYMQGYLLEFFSK